MSVPSAPGRRLSNKELAWATMGSRDFLDAPDKSADVASAVVPNGAPLSPTKTSMTGTRSSALKDFARQCSDGVEIDPKELGILFNTRAKAVSSHLERCAAWRSVVGRAGGASDGNPTEELSRIFPESTKEEFFFSSQSSSESSFGESEEPESRKWNTPFRRHSTVARSVMFLLKICAVSSCAFVIGAFSVEPICIKTAYGTPLERVFSGSHGFEALLRLGDFLLNSVYFFLALVDIFLIGAIDRRRAEELISMRDVLRKHRRSPTTWLDVVAFCGFVGELVHLGEAVRFDRQFTGAQWFSLLQLCKAWRLILPEAQVQIHRITLLEGIGRLFFTTAFLSHMIASILLAIGNQEASQGERNWIDVYFGSEVKCAELYFETFYFAALSLTSVGYGDILITPLEHGVNGFLLLCTQLFTAKVCADLTWLTSLHNYWEAEHQARRAQTWASLQNMNVPTALSQRVLAYQSYMATVHREDLDQPIFQNLSENLIQELRLCAYRKLVLQAPFLREQPKEVIAFVVGSLKDEVFLPADFVLRFGDRGRELFFVRRGSLVVYMGAEAPVWGVSNEVAWYGAGNYFGELAMLTGRPRAAWIMATTYCVISQLPYTAVEALSVEHPSSFTRLVQSMIKEYDLRATLTWDDVAERMQAKYCFLSTEEAYNWCCTMGQELDVEDLTAKAFDRAMLRLKVPPLDTKIFWAELDVDSDGTVSLEEFECRVTEEMISRPIRRPNRNMTGASDAWRSQASSTRKKDTREEEFQSSEAGIEVKATPAFLPGAPVDDEDMPHLNARKEVVSLTQDRFPLAVAANRDPRRDSTSLDSPLARERAGGNLRNSDATSPTNTPAKFADPSPSNSGKSLQSPIPSRECRSPQPQSINMDTVDHLLAELHEGFERAQRAANALRELHLSASMASTSLT